MQGTWVNQGTFLSGTGTVAFTGPFDGSITGATTFNILHLDKAATGNAVVLYNSIQTPEVNMNRGTLYTGPNAITITGNRSGPATMIGTVTRTHAFSSGVAYAFEGPHNTITLQGVSGVTTVTSTLTQGVVANFPLGGAVNRYYDINIPQGSYTGATLRLQYLTEGLNGNTENLLLVWKETGGSWVNTGREAISTTDKWVEKSGLPNLNGRWTLSDSNDNTIYHWNGSVSSAWETPANWTVLQTTPAVPPTADHIVVLGSQVTPHMPVISSVAQAKYLYFESQYATTLTISPGNSLTTAGNVYGIWNTNATHTLRVGDGHLTVGTNLLLSDGSSGNRINLEIGTGSVFVTRSMSQEGGANVTFTGAGTLTVQNDYRYTSGAFVAGTGKVVYQNSQLQTVAPLGYHHLEINKTEGEAVLMLPTQLTGNLTIKGTGTFRTEADLTVAGNMLLHPNATLRSQGGTIAVGGNWTEEGTFWEGTGTVIFNGTGTQTIGTGSQTSQAVGFNNLTINKASGEVVLGVNILIDAGLTIQSGTLNLGSFRADRTAVGGIFAMAGGSRLLVGGADNFPNRFNTNTFSPSSTVD